MPLTPFHLASVWPLWLKGKRKLHFVCISLGSAIPDIEVLLLSPFTGEREYARGLMHSYLGAFTIDVMITLVVAYLLVPPLGRWLRSRKGEDWHIFAGVDIARPPRDLGWAVVSALIGTVSHVTLDVFTHVYNPILFPYYTNQNINLLIFGDTIWTQLVFYVPLGIIMFYMLFKYWAKK